MEKYEINFFTTTDDQIKCAVSERFDRTLRYRLYRYMHWNGPNRYIDALQDIVNSYNHSRHRSIGMALADVNQDNEAILLKNFHPPSDFKVKNKLEKEKFVRISKKKRIFEKGGTKNWTEEIFKWSRRKKTPLKYIYHLEDLASEPITSIFYPEDLNAVNQPHLYKARI